MATDTDGPSPNPGAGHNTARLKDLYRTMVRIRAFEEAAMAAHKAGEMPGPLHVSIGQEGVAAGICANLRDEDRLILRLQESHQDLYGVPVEKDLKLLADRLELLPMVEIVSEDAVWESEPDDLLDAAQ